MYQIIVFLLALVSFVPHSLAQNCDPAVFTPASAPLITKTSSYNGVPITLTGTLSILDGCRFQVDGFTYTTALPLSFWFGSNGLDSTGTQIVQAQVAQVANPANIQYQLMNGTKFDSFNTILLASKADNVIIGYAQISKPNQTTTNNGTGSTPPNHGSSRSMNEGINGFVIGAGMLLVATFFVFQ
ncbi:5139_t:CDS:2 [Paraglomus occultum]|uniref:5139_t:CDS:1 n=1 Tax=Paraglomus occultum TaxID=144539 RepID=A0A9N8VPM1_9GLOM|nr:5139_t:CDS:2 [Paraglomus occultum]